MPQNPLVDDAYIDGIIKAVEPYDPNLNRTQGVKMRELVKHLRDNVDLPEEDDYPDVDLENYATQTVDVGIGNDAFVSLDGKSFLSFPAGITSVSLRSDFLMGFGLLNSNTKEAIPNTEGAYIITNEEKTWQFPVGSTLIITELV